MKKESLIYRIWQILFVQESGIKRYFANTSWLLGARVFQMLISLIIGGMVARYLGPNQYGTYNYVLSFVAIFSALSTMGIASVVVKDMLGENVSTNKALGTGFVLKIAGSSLAFLLILVCTFLIEDAQAVRLLLLIAALQTVLRSTDIINSYFQAKVESRKTVKAQMISLVIVSVLRLSFIFSGKPLIWFIWMMPLDAFIIGSILLYNLKKTSNSIPKWEASTTYARTLLAESWPSLFSGVFVTIYMKVDQVMLQNLLDSSSVGYYAAAARLSEVWITVPWIISGSLFPAMVNSYKEDKEAFQTRINQAYILLIGLALIVSIPVAIFAGPIIHLIFGSDYDPSVNVLRLHIFSCLFIFLGSVSNRWLVILQKQKYWMINSGLGAIMNILLNLWLIPAYGIIGAACATLLSYSFAYYLAFAIFHETRPIFITQTRNFIRVLSIGGAWKEIKKIKKR